MRHNYYYCEKCLNKVSKLDVFTKRVDGKWLNYCNECFKYKRREVTEEEQILDKIGKYRRIVREHKEENKIVPYEIIRELDILSRNLKAVQEVNQI